MPVEPDAIRAALGSTLDADHVEAVIANRAEMCAELTTGEALALARWCDDFSDPNLAAEVAIGRRYQGIRGVSRPAPSSPSRAAKRKPGAGTIVQASEPAAFKLAIQLSGWEWKANWLAVDFPADIAERARLRTAGRPALRVVK